MKKLHMFDVLFIAIVLYCLAAVFAYNHLASTVLWKLGNACAAAFIGYWVDWCVFSNWSAKSAASVPPDLAAHFKLMMWAAMFIRRAIIVAAVILAVGLGL